MDLLGSILSTMDKPPEVDEKQKELIKKQKAHMQKVQEYEKREIMKFRKFCEERINRFTKDDNRKSIQFQPLPRIYRTVVHDVAAIAGFTAMSFGDEDVDRYIVVYKKEFGPSEDEIVARRNGQQWNDEVAKEYAQKRLEAKRKISEKTDDEPSKIEPNSNYKDKYVHLIGHEAALDAARRTETNKSYGFVPSANKKDTRTIEHIQNDIQAKKKQKKLLDTAMSDAIAAAGTSKESN